VYVITNKHTLLSFLQFGVSFYALSLCQSGVFVVGDVTSKSRVSGEKGLSADCCVDVRLSVTVKHVTVHRNGGYKCRRLCT